ncbi:MAG: hypothetical protein GX051_10780, partial [Clostridiales bacterium]|nr:hypothetical protein [Clostridiales bacterium]
MKKILKHFLAIAVCLLALMTTASSADSAAASEAQQDGLKAVLITDKDAYEKNDEIDVSLSITNTSGNKFGKVWTEITIPESLTLKSGSLTSGEFSLEPNADKTLKLTSVLTPVEESTPEKDKGFPFLLLLLIIPVGIVVLICIRKKSSKSAVIMLLVCAAVAGAFGAPVIAHALGSAMKQRGAAPQIEQGTDSVFQIEQTTKSFTVMRGVEVSGKTEKIIAVIHFDAQMVVPITIAPADVPAAQIYQPDNVETPVGQVKAYLLGWAKRIVTSESGDPNGDDLTVEEESAVKDYKAFENGAEIGIYMKDSGSNPSVMNDNKNCRYKADVKDSSTARTSNFVNATIADKMYYPDGSTNVGFYAYYPFDGGMEGEKAVNMDLFKKANQQKWEKYDIISADTARDGGSYGSNKPNITLQFKHKMAKVDINFTLANDLKKLGYSAGSVMKVVLTDQFRQARYVPLSDELMLPYTTDPKTADIPMKCRPNNQYSITAEAIVFPDDRLSRSAQSKERNRKIVIYLKGNGTATCPPRVFEFPLGDKPNKPGQTVYDFNEGLLTEFNFTLNSYNTIAEEVAPVYPQLLVFTDSDNYNVPEGAVGTAIIPIDVSGGASGGTPPYTFSFETGAPSWLSITDSGVISGTRPSGTASATTATVKVTDSAIPTPATKTITIAIGAVTPAPAAPTITVQPVAKSIFFGQTATFSVDAEGYPAPSYQW